jgi:hypothetical protein
MTSFIDFDETAAAEFIASGDSRETSSEIMQAIDYFARDLSEAEALWAGDGFGVVCQVSDLWENVTQNGLHDATEFCWGAAGRNWMDALTA